MATPPSARRSSQTGAELPDERNLCLSPRRAHHLVSGGNQSWKKVSAYGAGGTGYENPHARVLRTSLLPQGRWTPRAQPSLEAHQREPDSTGHQEPSDVPPALAIELGAPGNIYNIVDDEPAPVREWLPALAAMLGAKPPRHVPAWLGRLVAGEHLVVMMNEARAGSNAKAKRELGRQPAHPRWRQGFAEIVRQHRAAARSLGPS
jgi:hypothetical protein